jgi:hypothetical protein
MDQCDVRFKQPEQEASRVRRRCRDSDAANPDGAFSRLRSSPMATKFRKPAK